jgi:hypothetical protein
MYITRLTVAGLLLASPLLSLAQEAAPAPLPRFYGGLAAYSSTYNNLVKRESGFTVPLQATLGYQLHPRWAVQLGVAYGSYSNSFADVSLDPTGQPHNSRSDELTSRNTSLSLLTRYTLMGQPVHRLQFDLLGGFTLEHGGYHNQGYYTDNQHPASIISYDSHYVNNTFLLTLGGSVRYRLGQHLELVYDLTTNRDISTSRQYAYSGFTGSMALGLRYRFGS